MDRLIVLMFGGASYVVFLGVFLYLVAFLADLPVPYTVDAGRSTGPVPLAVAIDVLLVTLFGLQHSVMARSGFKDWLHRRLPRSAERSVYVLLASAVLALLMWQWRPLPMVVWHAESGAMQAVAWSGFVAGFGIVLLSTFLIDHFDLFGLKQVWSGFTRRETREPQFTTPLFYRLVRHPLYFGFLLAFWSAPTMTAGRMLFAASMTVYILIAIRFEERDLVRFHGPLYERYRSNVPMLLPRPWRRTAG